MTQDLDPRLAPTTIEARAWAYLEQAHANNTQRAYRSDWRHFEAWCQAQGREALPATPETLARYLTEMADQLSVGTLSRRLSALSAAHDAGGFESPAGSPLVRTLLRGIRRSKGVRPKAKRPLLVEDLEAGLELMPDSTAGLRDSALLLAGFAGAFRRSELVGLDWEDLEFGEEGVKITIRRSKTDQEGMGRILGIPRSNRMKLCPVRALERWRTVSGFEQGAVFRAVAPDGSTGLKRLSDRMVARIVQRWMSRAGREATAYGAHSLRSGLATAAARGGASERSIMRQTGHRSTVMVRRYIQEATVFEENAVLSTGLR